MLQKARGRFELLHRQQPYRDLPALDRTWLLAPLILADNKMSSPVWYKQTNVEAFILININHLLKLCLLKGPTNITQDEKSKGSNRRHLLTEAVNMAMLTYSASTPGITRLPQQTQARFCSQGKIPPFHYNPVKAETLPGINERELGIQRTSH